MPGRAAPGMRLFGDMTGTDVHLVDDQGRLGHVWTSHELPGHGVYLLEDGTLLRSINTAGKGNGAGGAVQRVAWDSTVVWEFHYDGPGVLSHHDIAPLPNGNVILIAWEDLTAAQAVALGRDPALIAGDLFQPDHLVEIQPTGPTSGNIVWQWHLTDHVVQDREPRLANYGRVGSSPELVDINYPPVRGSEVDWNHMNGIDYDVENDWIVVSCHHQNEIWIIDHGTTTKEAASHSGGRRGKGGDLLYRWGNPAAYRAGTVADQQLFGQHDPRFVRAGRPGAGHLTLFNNNFRPNRSAVFELQLPLDAAGNFDLRGQTRWGPDGPVWQFSEAGFFSPIISGAERLPNGNTLICAGVQGKLFEVTPNGETVWYYKNNGWVFQAHYVESSLWAPTSTVSRSAGGVLDFDIVTGTAHAGELFMLLGSAAGTNRGIDLDGLHVPLNQDLLMLILWWNASSGALGRSAGMLDALGAGAASVRLAAYPFNPILLGQTLDFACTFTDPNSLQTLRVSNGVKVRIVQ